jgi:ABC-2 type transport system ATP-binding protein
VLIVFSNNPVQAIVCENLSRSFGSVRAVEGISFAVDRGAVFTLLGPNGAGKTTTIHLLLGLLHPDSGRAAVFDLDPRHDGDRLRASAGVLLEHHGLYERLTVSENLEAFARITRVGPAERKARIGELLEMFGLAGRRDSRTGTLSRGMKQKLAIARALIHRPPLLFLDEPTAGLDPEAAVELRTIIAGLAQNAGTTIFLNTHNLIDAEKLSTTIAIMRAGKLIAIGTAADIRARVGGEITIVGTRLDDAMADAVRGMPNVDGASLTGNRLSIRLRGGSSVAPLVRELVTRGAEIEEVRRESAPLEDAFLHIVREDRA